MNIEMQVTNIPETKAYELTEEEKVPVIKNWLGWKGLQLLQTSTHEEKEKWTTIEGLFAGEPGRVCSSNKHPLMKKKKNGEL